jgi:hypothetical protein
MGASRSVAAGLKAGGIFLGVLAGGILLSCLITLVVAIAYMSILDGGEGAPAARAGGAGAIFVLLFHPEFLVFFLLCFYFLVYSWLSFFYAWRCALWKIALNCGGDVSDRLSGAIMERLSSVPRARETLRGAGNLISEANLLKTIESVSGKQRIWLRRAARFALSRLPWYDLLADLRAHAGHEQETLANRINDGLREIAKPPLRPLILVVIGQAALFGIGAWFAT